MNRCLLITALLMVPAGCAPPPLQRFEYTRLVMGVRARIIAYACSAPVAERAATAAFARMEVVEEAASDYRADNELARLCRAGDDFQPVSADLHRLLVLSERFARLTDGAFDVTVGPLSQLWRRARREGRMPGAEDLAAARRCVGWRSVLVDHHQPRVRLLRAGTRLDFGGIAKGYAADRAQEVLRERGIARCLVSLAGDVVTGDPPPHERGWQIEVQTTADGSATTGPSSAARCAVVIHNAAISTSGDAEQFVELEGLRYSHIVDPRSGLGLIHRSSASVTAPDGATADALATALCVLGPEGLATAARMARVEARVIGGDGTRAETPGWKSMESVR